MIQFGVIGLGYWGPKLARNLHALPGARLAWGCDLSPARLAQLSSLYPDVRVTRDYREVLKSDVDAVCIATPVGTHFELALQALRAGKHILVEKPLASCSYQAEQIIAEGILRDRVVMVGHTFVYNPAVVAMRDLLARGELGDLYYINATRVNLGLFQPDINVAWDLAPHDISILIYLLGQAPTEVSAHGEVYVQPRRGLHEVAYLTLHFPDGVMADIRVSWLDPRKIRQYTVVGSDKMLVYDDLEPVNKLVLYDKGVDLPPYTVTEEEFRLSYRTGEGVPHPIQWEEPLQLECQHFLECIVNKLEPRTDGRNGLQVIQALEAAQASLLNGGGREVVGEPKGFCAHRTRREVGPRCETLCFRQLVRV